MHAAETDAQWYANLYESWERLPHNHAPPRRNTPFRLGRFPRVAPESRGQ